MEFVLQHKTPAQRFGGLALVALAHVIVVGALMPGVKRTIPLLMPPEPVTLVNIPDAPKPPPQKLETPKQAASVPQPVQIPQPVVIDTPPVADVISLAPATDVTPNNPGPVAAATSTGSGLPSTGVAAACPNSQGIRSTMRYPPEARRQGLQGDVLARFVVAANGEIRNIDIVSSSNRAFNSAVLNAVRQFACAGQGRDVVVEVPFTFRLE
jgi:periplasmic protein TonB